MLPMSQRDKELMGKLEAEAREILARLAAINQEQDKIASYYKVDYSIYTLSNQKLMASTGYSRKKLGSLRSRKYDPLPYVRVGADVRYNPKEVAEWFARQAS